MWRKRAIFPVLEPKFVMSCFLLNDTGAFLDGYFTGFNKRKIFILNLN